MGRLIPFDPDGRQAVTETDLFNIISLQERVAGLQACIDQIATGVVDRLKASAEVEHGSRYEPRLEIVQILAGVTEERLIIDGICRWRRVTGTAAAILRQAHNLAVEPI